jgi:RND family efflux transporter MFP subunit
MALDQEALQALRGERTRITPGSGSKRRSRQWWYLAAAALLAVVAFFVFGRKPLTVTTATAVALAVDAGPAAVLDASGFVVARRQATVSAKITGKVTAVYVEEGMSVKEGQILARLDNSQAGLQHGLAQRQIEAANSGLTQVQVRLAEAQRTLTRNEKLMNDGLVSQAALDATAADVAALRAQQATAESQLAVTRSSLRLRAQDLDDLVIRAPFAGVVISKDAQPGEMVSPISAGGGYTRTGIATIVDMDSREIEVDVNESYINRVRDGQRTEATLDAYPDWHIPSHVLNIVPAADRQKATVRVRIAFDQLDPRILTDMGVKVRFMADAPVAGSTPHNTNVVLVPAEALVSDNGQEFVWTLQDGKALRTAVTSGSTREGNMEVTTGLKPGDTVIAPVPEGLTASQRVRVAAP